MFLSNVVDCKELVLRGDAYQLEESSRFLIDNRLRTHVIWGHYQGEDGEGYDSYGIQVENLFGIIRRIPDITTDSTAITNLVDSMNRLRVSKHHIDDIVEDFLAGSFSI